MTDYKTKEELFDAMKNPSQEDLENIAINLIRNFRITKNETDSFGNRTVHYKIVELEIYFYNKENDDWPTYNRDCAAGQWFFHKSGVDIAFQTLRNESELIQFGGVLIRGLERIVDGKTEYYIGGAKRCMYELFNSADGLPEITVSGQCLETVIYKGKRINIEKEDELRYYRPIKICEWNIPRKTIITKKSKECYLVLKEEKTIKYSDAPPVDEEGKSTDTQIYPK